MREVFNFVLEHYEAILSVLTLIISVAILIIRKKPVSDIVAWIYQNAVVAVNDVEESGLKGKEQKLAAAIQIINGLLKVKYPDLNVDIYSGLIKEIIENILSTPQKKEVK